MDWKRAIGEERAMLKSIVALLLSLADLAELAQSRSRAMCRFIFWILHPAETAAWELACPNGLLPEPIARSGNVHTDVRQLALRFRWLARVLECEAELAFPCRPESGSRSGAARHGIDWIRQVADALKAVGVVPLVQVPDTS
jgi:hypothetical protein